MTGLVLKDIRKSYGPVKVLHGIDLQIEKGEFIVFVGPSGCGKSTLLLLIAMMNADSFVLFSRLCCASCALRPASLLPPGSSSKMLFSSIMQQSVSKASWHRLCPPRAQK